METVSFAILNKVQEDLRAGPAHISLMAAILHLHAAQGNNGFIETTGRELRALLRIGGKGTYYKYLSDLQRFGYIGYEATRSGKRESRISVLHP